MKKKLKLFLFLISCFAYLNFEAQSAVIPVTTPIPLIWTNPDGTSGSCQQPNSDGSAICSTTICLGESICFSYQVNQTQPGNLDLADYNLNHTTLSFSDGGSIIVENIDYTGPNPTGCVDYAPTSIGIITTYGVNNSTFNIYVLPSTPPVLSANITPPNSICEGSQVCAQALTFPSANYSFSSTTALGCFDGIFCNTPNTSAFCFPVGNNQILYTVNAGHTCSNTAVYNVNVVPSTLLLTVTNPPACTNNYCFNVTASAACNLGILNYTWNISDNNGNTVYYQTNTLQNICVPMPPGTHNISVYAGANLYAYTTITVPPIDACACQACTNPIGTGGTISSSPVANQKYCINNNVTITGNVTFANSEFKIGTNINITIANNAILTINRSHLYSGASMWTGIIIQNGGKLNIENNSLIEDAITGVKILNHTTQTTILKVDASIFNKNANSIEIRGYNQNIPTYPFIITNSLFTCRRIADCSTIAGWPLTATVKAATNPVTSPLETPYINNTTYPVVNMKAPYANNKSFRGLLIANVGTSNVTTTSSSYNEITIGTLIGTNTYNVFDNVWYGIDAQNSNISVVNSIFQNGYDLAFPSLYSTGIRSTALTTTNCRLQASTSSYSNNNKFYNLTRAIFTQYLHDLNVNYCEMYSTKKFIVSVPTKLGAYGVSSLSNHYNNLNLNNNKIFNIDNAIVFNASIATYAVGTASGNGQYLGSIYANNNIISSHVTGYTPSPSLHYGFKGISITGMFSANTVIQPNATIQINDNNILDYENGISCSNWNPMGVITKLNTVTIRNKATNVYQYGIEHVNNTLYGSYSFKTYGIVENNVTANAISITANNYAIRSVQNGNYSVLCNTVSNTYNGLAFSGTHINNASVNFNFMSTNRYGFVLENSGIIGPQGSSAPDGSAYFAENQWLGTWISPNFKTAVLSLSNAQLSKMYVRTVPATFNPDGSGISVPSVLSTAYSITSGNILTVPIEGTFTNCYLGKPAPTNPNVDALELIASSGATSGIEHAAARFVAKSQLFVYLQNNPTAKTPGILTGFYNSNKHKYRDRFFDVETNVAEGDINSAKNAVAAFNPQNSTEDKHKQFFDLLFKYQNQTINTADEQSLLVLAKGCPYIDGTAVHQARALYNLVTGQNISFTDSCDYSQSNARLGKIADEIYDEETSMGDNEVFLYPNPSNGSDLFVSLTKTDTESVDVIINNVNGVAISKETINLVNGIGKLSIKASNGVYMVIITNNKTNERVIKKLVIQK
jgi:hypothetical protein